MKTSRLTPWIVLLALAAFPLVAPQFDLGFYVSFVRRVMIFALAAASLNFILGYGGMVALGHAAFFGAGAYCVAIMAAEGVNSALLAWPVALLVVAALAAMIGAVSLRTRGVYFIMITLAFAQIHGSVRHCRAYVKTSRAWWRSAIPFLASSCWPS